VCIDSEEAEAVPWAEKLVHFQGGLCFVLGLSRDVVKQILKLAFLLLELAFVCVLIVTV
jgi:hypothetical protein